MLDTTTPITPPMPLLHAYRGKAAPSKIFTNLQRRKLQNRAYQARIATRIDTNWRKGIRSQLIESPAGSGKTTMALDACRRLVREVGPKLWNCKPEEIGVFWMAMRKNLLRQTLKSNLEFFEYEEEEEFCPNLHYVSSFANNPPIGNYKHRILVQDEAHHSSTESELAVLAAIAPTFTIGLSATPDRPDNHRLSFQATIKDAGYRTLIKEGYLSKFRYYAMSHWSPEQAVATFLQNPEHWGQTLFFFRTIEECTRATELLAAGGFPTDICHGGVDRNSVLRPFESEERQCLVSMAILGEGYDYPALNTVFARDTGSHILSTQMAGRVLRLHQGRIKNIVQTVKCRHPFPREADPCEQYVQRDGGWVAVKESVIIVRLMEEVAKRMRDNLGEPVILPDWEKVCKSINKGGKRVKTKNVDEENVEEEDDEEENE